MGNPDVPPPPPPNELMAPPEPIPGSSQPALEGHAVALAGGPQATAPSSVTIDEAAKQEFLWQTHEYLSEYARFADTKAGFAGTAAAALIGAIYGAKAHLPMLQTIYSQWEFSTWLIAGAIAFLVLTVLLAVWTIRPRLRSAQSKGFVFWESIAAHKRIELLRTSFHRQSARTLNDHLLQHVFDISVHVCVPKYRHVSLCLLCLTIGGFLAGAGLLSQGQRQAVIVSSPAVDTPASSKP